MNGFEILALCVLVLAAFSCGMMSVFDGVRCHRQRRFSRCACGKVMGVRPYRSHSRLSDGEALRVERYSCIVSVSMADKYISVRVDSPTRLQEGSEVAFWYDPERPKDTLLVKVRETCSCHR